MENNQPQENKKYSVSVIVFGGDEIGYGYIHVIAKNKLDAFRKATNMKSPKILDDNTQPIPASAVINQYDDFTWEVNLDDESNPQLVYFNNGGGVGKKKFNKLIDTIIKKAKPSEGKHIFGQYLFYGKEITLDFKYGTEGDWELDLPDVIEKIEILSRYIDFDKLTGHINSYSLRWQLFKNDKLVCSFNGNYDSDADSFSSVLIIEGKQTSIFNSHPYDGMGGLNEKEFADNINSALNEIKSTTLYSSVIEHDGYAIYKEYNLGYENAKKNIKNIKDKTKFLIVEGKQNYDDRIENDKIVDIYNNGGGVGDGVVEVWITNALTTDKRILSQIFNYPIAHEQLYDYYNKQGYEIKDSQIHKITNRDVLQNYKDALANYIEKKFSKNINWDFTFIPYSVVKDKMIIDSHLVSTTDGNEIEINPNDLFNYFNNGGGVGKNSKDKIVIKNIKLSDLPKDIYNALAKTDNLKNIDSIKMVSYLTWNFKDYILNTEWNAEEIYNEISSDLSNYIVVYDDYYTLSISTREEYGIGGGIEDNFDYGSEMTDENLVRENLMNGEISCAVLRDIIGCEPEYPYQIVGSIKLQKCFLRPYYKLA